MEKILDESALGVQNCATIDCACFYDRSEFRRPGHFTWEKAIVRIQELDGRAKFLAGIWKRFFTGGEIDIRVNYGFTSKREFARSLKIQELNYENIPVVEKKNGRFRRAIPAAKAPRDLRTRWICHLRRDRK